MRISIALATCNGARFLQEQLESLLLQTHTPYELIVSDDSSTDETMSIVANFSRRAPFPVKFCSNAGPLGFTENSLRAASACGGDAIAFCAQYDVWREDKLARCAVELARQDVCLVVHQFVATDEHLQESGGCIPRTRSSMVLERLQPEPELAWLPGCAMVFRRSVLREVLHRWPSPHAEFAQEFGCSILSHDGAVFFVANGMGRISYLAEPLVWHRSSAPSVQMSPADCRMIRASSELYELMACQENKAEIAKALRELTRSLRHDHRLAHDHKPARDHKPAQPVAAPLYKVV